jgi:hypothetical protein
MTYVCFVLALAIYALIGPTLQLPENISWLTSMKIHGMVACILLGLIFYQAGFLFNTISLCVAPVMAVSLIIYKVMPEELNSAYVLAGCTLVTLLVYIFRLRDYAAKYCWGYLVYVTIIVATAVYVCLQSAVAIPENVVRLVTMKKLIAMSCLSLGITLFQAELFSLIWSFMRKNISFIVLLAFWSILLFISGHWIIGGILMFYGYTHFRKRDEDMGGLKLLLVVSLWLVSILLVLASVFG